MAKYRLIIIVTSITILTLIAFSFESESYYILVPGLIIWQTWGIYEQQKILKRINKK